VETPHNVENLRPVERKPPLSMLNFHLTKSFHAKSPPGPDGRAGTQRTAIKDTTPPVS